MKSLRAISLFVLIVVASLGTSDARADHAVNVMGIGIPASPTDDLPRQVRDWIYSQPRPARLPSIWRLEPDVVERMRAQCPVQPLLRRK